MKVTSGFLTQLTQFHSCAAIYGEAIKIPTPPVCGDLTETRPRIAGVLMTRPKRSGRTDGRRGGERRRAPEKGRDER